jgi:hypothetical protein
MRRNGLLTKTSTVIFIVFSCIRLVSPICSWPAEDTPTTFLKNIDYFGRTIDELVRKLGAPEAATYGTTARSVTTYYYRGLTAVFDVVTGNISVLVITDGAWKVDGSVRIGATKRDVGSALGDNYCRIEEDSGSDVWVYFCPKPSSDTEAGLCDHCRLCYIFFKNDKVYKIEWSTEILQYY